MAIAMLGGGQGAPQPAEFQKAIKTGGTAVTLIIILLVVTLMFMVFSGYAF